MNGYVYVDGGRTLPVCGQRNGHQMLKGRVPCEILLTSMNADGTKSGFSIGITSEISRIVSIPVIASGGAGTKDHFREVFTKTSCSAALAASIFHFGEIPLPELKEYLSGKGNKRKNLIINTIFTN